MMNNDLDFKRKSIGKKGEKEAVNYLKKIGYKIIEKNFLCKQGEIDIIAKDTKNNEYVFIEVKNRTNYKYGKPEEAVNKYKQKHIVNSTKYYLYKNNLEKNYIRFDTIAIYNHKITHYKNCDFQH